MTFVRFLFPTTYRYYLQFINKIIPIIQGKSAIIIRADFRNPKRLIKLDFRNPKILTYVDFTSRKEVA